MEIKVKGKDTIKLVNITSNECTGCSTCCNICPTQSIDMVPDRYGFLVPQINMNTCISCGICENRCQVLSPTMYKANRSELSVFAAYSLNTQTRYESTSGGIFSEIAYSVIENGGYVVGVKYDNNMNICHDIAKVNDEISLLRQSKYAQSDKKLIFKKIKELLDKEKTVLFVGTPCENVGLLMYLNNRPNNLILVDFICLGVNSPLVYRKYLDNLEKKYKSTIKRIWFKYKAVCWNLFSTRIDFANGKQYVKSRYSDLFMKGYIEKSLYIRFCCEHCVYKSVPHESDITLGDFWGVERFIPNIDSTDGVSVVMVNSEKGKNILEFIKEKIFCVESTLDAVIESNRRLYSSVKLDTNAKAFYKLLEKDGFEKAIVKYTKVSFLIHLKKKVKYIILRIKYNRQRMRRKDKKL